MKSNQAIHKTAPKASPIFRRVIVVLLTLVLSIACYGVTVFAWFQAEVLNAGNTIQSGSYTIAVNITEKGTSTPVPEQNGVYTLEEGKGYSVTLTAVGNTSGYCVITAGGETWNTLPITGSELFTLTIYPEATEAYTFQTVWGAATVEDGLNNGTTIGTEPSGQSDLPQEPTTTPTEEPPTAPTEEPATAPAEESPTAPAEEPTTTPTEAATDQPESQTTEPDVPEESQP